MKVFSGIFSRKPHPKPQASPASKDACNTPECKPVEETEVFATPLMPSKSDPSTPQSECDSFYTPCDTVGTASKTPSHARISALKSTKAKEVGLKVDSTATKGTQGTPPRSMDSMQEAVARFVEADGGFCWISNGAQQLQVDAGEEAVGVSVAAAATHTEPATEGRRFSYRAAAALDEVDRALRDGGVALAAVVAGLSPVPMHICEEEEEEEVEEIRPGLEPASPTASMMTPTAATTTTTSAASDAAAAAGRSREGPIPRTPTTATPTPTAPATTTAPATPKTTPQPKRPVSRTLTTSPAPGLAATATPKASPKPTPAHAASPLPCSASKCMTPTQGGTSVLAPGSSRGRARTQSAASTPTGASPAVNQTARLADHGGTTPTGPTSCSGSKIATRQPGHLSSTIPACQPGYLSSTQSIRAVPLTSPRGTTVRVCGSGRTPTSLLLPLSEAELQDIRRSLRRATVEEAPHLETCQEGQSEGSTDEDGQTNPRQSERATVENGRTKPSQEGRAKGAAAAASGRLSSAQEVVTAVASEAQAVEVTTTHAALPSTAASTTPYLLQRVRPAVLSPAHGPGPAFGLGKDSSFGCSSQALEEPLRYERTLACSGPSEPAEGIGAFQHNTAANNSTIACEPSTTAANTLSTNAPSPAAPCTLAFKPHSTSANSNTPTCKLTTTAKTITSHRQPRPATPATTSHHHQPTTTTTTTATAANNNTLACNPTRRVSSSSPSAAATSATATIPAPLSRKSILPVSRRPELKGSFGPTNSSHPTRRSSLALITKTKPSHSSGPLARHSSVSSTDPTPQGHATDLAAACQAKPQCSSFRGGNSTGRMSTDGPSSSARWGSCQELPTTDVQEPSTMEGQPVHHGGTASPPTTDVQEPSTMEGQEPSTMGASSATDDMNAAGDLTAGMAGDLTAGMAGDLAAGVAGDLTAGMAGDLHTQVSSETDDVTMASIQQSTPKPATTPQPVKRLATATATTPSPTAKTTTATTPCPTLKAATATTPRTTPKTATATTPPPKPNTAIATTPPPTPKTAISPQPTSKIATAMAGSHSVGAATTTPLPRPKLTPADIRSSAQHTPSRLLKSPTPAPYRPLPVYNPTSATTSLISKPAGDTPSRLATTPTSLMSASRLAAASPAWCSASKTSTTPARSAAQVAVGGARSASMVQVARTAAKSDVTPLKAAHVGPSDSVPYVTDTETTTSKPDAVGLPQQGGPAPLPSNTRSATAKRTERQPHQDNGASAAVAVTPPPVSKKQRPLTAPPAGTNSVPPLGLQPSSASTARVPGAKPSSKPSSRPSNQKPAVRAQSQPGSSPATDAKVVAAGGGGGGRRASLLLARTPGPTAPKTAVTAASSAAAPRRQPARANNTQLQPPAAATRSRASIQHAASTPPPASKRQRRGSCQEADDQAEATEEHVVPNSASCQAASAPNGASCQAASDLLADAHPTLDSHVAVSECDMQAMAGTTADEEHPSRLHESCSSDVDDGEAGPIQPKAAKQTGPSMRRASLAPVPMPPKSSSRARTMRASLDAGHPPVRGPGPTGSARGRPTRGAGREVDVPGDNNAMGSSTEMMTMTTTTRTITTTVTTARARVARMSVGKSDKEVAGEKLARRRSYAPPPLPSKKRAAAAFGDPVHHKPSAVAIMNLPEASVKLPGSEQGPSGRASADLAPDTILDAGASTSTVSAVAGKCHATATVVAEGLETVAKEAYGLSATTAATAHAKAPRPNPVPLLKLTGLRPNMATAPATKGNPTLTRRTPSANTTTTHRAAAANTSTTPMTADKPTPKCSGRPNAAAALGAKSSPFGPQTSPSRGVVSFLPLAAHASESKSARDRYMSNTASPADSPARAKKGTPSARLSPKLSPSARRGHSLMSGMPGSKARQGRGGAILPEVSEMGDGSGKDWSVLWDATPTSSLTVDAGTMKGMRHALGHLGLGHNALNSSLTQRGNTSAPFASPSGPYSMVVTPMWQAHHHEHSPPEQPGQSGAPSCGFGGFGAGGGGGFTPGTGYLPFPGAVPGAVPFMTPAPGFILPPSDSSGLKGGSENGISPLLVLGGGNGRLVAAPDPIAALDSLVDGTRVPTPTAGINLDQALPPLPKCASPQHCLTGGNTGVSAGMHAASTAQLSDSAALLRPSLILPPMPYNDSLATGSPTLQLNASLASSIGALSAGDLRISQFVPATASGSNLSTGDLRISQFVSAFGVGRSLEREQLP